MTTKFKNLFLYSFLSFVLSSDLLALEYIYALDAGYTDSSNLNQRSGGIAGQANEVGIALNVSNSNQKEWDLNLSGRFSYVDYSDAELNNEELSDLEGIALYQSSTSNFSLASLARLSEAPTNRFQSAEVNNLRNENVFAIQPNYFFKINSANKINMLITFVDYNLEDVENSPINTGSSSEDKSFLINYVNQINSTNSISLNARNGEVDFEKSIGQGAIDYDRKDYFFRWVVAGQANQLQVELGQSHVTDASFNEYQLDHKQLSYTRQINRTQSFDIIYSDGFNNPLRNNLATNTITVNQQNNNIARAQKVEERLFNYNINGDNLTTSLNYYHQTRDVLSVDNTEEQKGYSFNLVYRLSRVLDNSGMSSIRLSYGKSESEFDGLSANVLSNEVESYSVGYNYVYSSKLTFSLFYSVRDSLQIPTSGIETSNISKSTFFTVTYSDRGKL